MALLVLASGTDQATKETARPIPVPAALPVTQRRMALAHPKFLWSKSALVYVTNPGQSQFFDQAVLQGPVRAFNTPLGLAGTGTEALSDKT